MANPLSEKKRGSDCLLQCIKKDKIQLTKIIINVR